MFESYPCLYCGFNIATKNHLKEHRRDCSGSSFLKKLDLLNQPNVKKSPQNIFPLPTSFSRPIGVPAPQFPQIFHFLDPSLSLHLPEYEQCGWKAMSGTDLVKHRKSVHNDHRNPFEIYKQMHP